MARSSGTNSPVVTTFYSSVTSHVRAMRRVWLPGHSGISLNKAADILAGMALALQLIETLPPFACVLIARFRQCLVAQDALEHRLNTSLEIEHLEFNSKRSSCQTRLCESYLTSFYYGVPSLN